MFNFEGLGHQQLDVLKEVGNIGAGHAATALAQLLRERIKMTVPNATIVPLAHVSDELGGAEQLVVCIYMRVFGDAPGKILFFFSQSDALELLDRVLERQPGTTQSFGDLEMSALKEIGNIMTGAYLYAMTILTGFNHLSSVPAFACDMAGAILNTAVLLDLNLLENYALLIETQFSLPEYLLSGHFFLVPDPSALEKTLNALGLKT